MKKIYVALSILGLLALIGYWGWGPDVNQPIKSSSVVDPYLTSDNTQPVPVTGNQSKSPATGSEVAAQTPNSPTFVLPGTGQSQQPIVTKEPGQAPPVVQSPPATAKNPQQEMLGYINSERAKAKLAPLVLTTKLSDGAYLKSKDMADKGYFEHNSPTYGTPFAMMKSLGISYRTAAENIAFHQTVLTAHNAFMNSSGHRANILNPAFHKIGLGIYKSGSDLYITQWFTD